MNKIDDLIIKQAEKEAKERIKSYIQPDKIGYTGALRDEMKKILKEKGIDWKPNDREISID